MFPTIEASNRESLAKERARNRKAGFELSAAAQLFSIARNTFRETIRDRVLSGVGLFVLLLFGAALLLGELTDGQQARTIVNFGLSALLVFGAFVAVFVGVGLVSKEIEKRTVFAIFAKPVGRTEFLLGKYSGLCLTLTMNVALMSAAVAGALLFVGGSRFVAPALTAIYLLLLQLFIVTAVAFLFSSFSSPNLSALLTFFVIVIGNFAATLRSLADSSDSAAISFGLYSLYRILPNFAQFNVITAAAHGAAPTPLYLLGASAYAFVYISALLMLSAIVFSRRDFK